MRGRTGDHAGGQMTTQIDFGAFELRHEPTADEIKRDFPSYIAAKILRHLDKSTGDVTRGEFQCVRVLAIVSNQFMIQVFYETLRPDGKRGTQFMHFFPFTAAMRCLPVTETGQVVMIQEHRRQRGAWVQMLPAGGEKIGREIQVLVSELAVETGCRPQVTSRIIEMACPFMDDGASAERIHLLTVDKLKAPESHANPSEGIRGIVLVPWNEWKELSLAGMYDDIYCQLFAARCDYNSRDQRIIVRGQQKRLAGPKY